MAKRHLQHIKSSQANKVPTAADLLYGEIAVNYADGSESLFIKNSSDEIVSFPNSKVIEDNELAVAGAMAQLNDEIETISQAIEEDEYVVAEAIGSIDNDVKTLQVSVRNLENGVEEMNSVIVENEEVTAAALTDLNYRLTNLDVNTLHMVTWRELVNLRDDYDLMPGNFYRITDYVTKTSQENTTSAEHPFDIVVLALSHHELSEDAYAMINEDDEYFSENGANLSLWKIKYCLDNDTDRFSWAVSNTTVYQPDYWLQYDYDEDEWVEHTYKGDEFGIIQFDEDEMRLYPTDLDAYPDQIDECEYFQYTGNTIEFNDVEYYLWIKYEDCEEVDAYAILTSTLSIPLGDSNGTGVIYYMEDEWGNEAPYDFKNIQFERDLTDGQLDSTNGTTTSVYTFNWWDSNDGECKDGSIFCNHLHEDTGAIIGVCKNRIGETDNYTGYGNQVNSLTLVLPDNVFILIGEDYDFVGSFQNTLGNNCYKNTFRNYCHNNTFGIGCHDNTFGIGCHDNTFGNMCIYNSIGTSSYNNTFGDNCSYNEMAQCHDNVFGNSCDRNIFGNSCDRNIFGDFCYNNTFGGECTINTFGNFCYNNIFGDHNSFNTFGNYNSFSTFEDYCRYNTIGNNVQHINFQKDYMSNIIVEDGNSYINVTSAQTTSISSVVRNLTIAQAVNMPPSSGTSNNANVKTISHDTLNDNFQTIYKPTNSVEVSV